MKRLTQVLIGILWVLAGEGMAGAQGCPTTPCDITISTPAESVLSVTNSGQGKAATFSNSVNSNSRTVDINSLGSNTALQVTNQTSGGAADFQIPTATNPSDAVLVNSTSAGGRALYAMLKNIDGKGRTIEAETHGLGAAGLFHSLNAANEMATLGSLSNGKVALASLNQGLGVAALFGNLGDANRAAAIVGVSTGLGTVGGFLSSNQQSTEPTVMAGNAGQNSAARFFTLNPSNSQPGVEAISHGSGNAIRASSHTMSYGLEATNDASGGAIWAHTEGQTDNPSIIAATFHEQSYGHSIFATNHGLGSAARLMVQNRNNSSNAVLAYTRGTGHGLLSAGLGGGDSIHGIIPAEAADIYNPSPMPKLDGGRAAVRGLTMAEKGNAGTFRITNRENITAALYASHAGPGYAIAAENTGYYAILSRGGIEANGEVYIRRSPEQGPGLRVWGLWDDGVVARFSGDVEVEGILYASGKSFRIDHPLDPEQMYLNHASVESPEMMTVYSGTVLLGPEGEAKVDLPRYFEALNRDFRYQLTPVGGPAPNLHIKRKVTKNAFVIGGGTAGLEVCWQVTGVRKDPYAERHRSPAEVQKEAEAKGKYLHPKEWGKPVSQGIGWKEGLREQREAERKDPGKSIELARDQWQSTAKRIAEDEKRIQTMSAELKKKQEVLKKQLETTILDAGRLMRDTAKGMQTK